MRNIVWIHCQRFHIDIQDIEMKDIKSLFLPIDDNNKSGIDEHKMIMDYTNTLIQVLVINTKKNVIISQ